jgi:long-chain acyl-CoA synthetase
VISEQLRKVVQRYRDELAIIDGDQRITYGELLERVQAIRQWLQSALDLQPGDVIAASIENSWEFVACFFAVSELGCVLMPCNLQWRAAELRMFATALGFRGAVIEPRVGVEWDQISDLIPNGRILTADPIPWQGNPLRAVSPSPIASITEDAPALYIPTSGSTGTPRLVPRSHRNLIAVAENVSATLGIGPGRRFLSVVPFYFSNGFNNSLIVPLLSGATAVTMRKFSPGACAQLVHAEAVDTLFGSPLIYASLLDGERDFTLPSSLAHCFTSGGRMPSNVVERWRTRFGVPIRQLYGATETGVIAIERSESPPASPVGVCVGESIRGVDVVALGADGQSLQPGEIGELAVRSASVMSGYFGEPGLSNSRFHDGFFCTGDLGCIDSAGNLHLTGRKGRVINIGGVKVDPVEVERAIETLSNVASCHVDAVPNGHGGEVIRARVVARDGLPVTRPEVIERCRQELAEYKLPRVIEFLETSPANLAGKILRDPVPDSDSPNEHRGSS